MSKRQFNLSTFKQILTTVVLLTLLSGGVSIWLTTKTPLLPQESRVFEICNTTWNMGILAIFGLLGGKTTDRPTSNEDEEEN